MPLAELKISGAGPEFDGKEAVLAATVHVPGGKLSGVVLICWPGGSYTRKYWEFPADTYNFGAYMSARGHVVIAVDPLGVGESTRPSRGDEVGLDAMARAAAQFTEKSRGMIKDGTLDSGLKPIDDARFIGVGHSMGAILVTVQQAQFDSYDAVVVLGNAVTFRDTSLDPDVASASLGELMSSSAADHVRSGVPEGWENEYVMLNRDVMRQAFHLPDVPEAIVAADDALAVEWPRRAIVEAAAGYTASHASKVSVPVFLGLGKVDLTADPHGEVSNYVACGDITLFVMSQSGHCHNFSTDRTRLWHRLDKWLA